MNTYGAYKTYRNLKLHFTTEKFDIRDGGINVTEEQIEKLKNNIKMPLARLGKKYSAPQFIEYMVANFVAGDKYGGMYSGEGEKNYFAWQKRNQALSYTYKQDLLKLYEYEHFLPNLWDTSLGHPVILKSYLGQIICAETFIILNKLYKFSGLLDAGLLHDPVWENTSMLVRKYSPFIKIDQDDFKDITESIFLGA
jgi:hypothetical protein